MIKNTPDPFGKTKLKFVNGFTGVESYIGASKVRKSKQNGIMLYIEGRKNRVCLDNKKDYIINLLCLV